MYVSEREKRSVCLCVRERGSSRWDLGAKSGMGVDRASASGYVINMDEINNVGI